MQTFEWKPYRIIATNARRISVVLMTAFLLGSSWAWGHESMMGGGMMGPGMMHGGMMGGGYATSPQDDSKSSQEDNTPSQEDSNHGYKTGETLFREDCSQCHALPSPLAHKAGQWPSVVQRMQSHLRQYGGRALSDDDIQAILGYLKKHARH